MSEIFFTRKSLWLLAIAICMVAVLTGISATNAPAKAAADSTTPMGSDDTDVATVAVNTSTPVEHYWVKGLVAGVVMTPDGTPSGEVQEWKEWTTARINDSLVMEKPACYGLYLQPTRIDGSKVFFEKFGKEWCINRSDLTQDPRQTFQWKDVCSALDGHLLGFNAEHVQTLRDAVELAACTKGNVFITNTIMESLRLDGLYDPKNADKMSIQDIWTVLYHARRFE